MIDVENQIFTKIKTALTTAYPYPGLCVVGSSDITPPYLPCVSIEEEDNSIYTPGISTSENENFCQVMYAVNVYTNKADGKKAECKKIFQVADGAMSALGFIRQSRNPISLDDSTKYRITARYVAVIGKDEKIYRR